jgi:hypothetical protein
MGIPAGFTQEEWDGLGPEEQAALQADETEDPAAIADQQAKLALEQETDDESTVEEGADDAEGKPAAEAETAKAQAKESAKDADKEPATSEAEPEGRKDFIPQLKVPEGRDLDAEEAELVKKYEEGEIPEAEYRKALREIATAAAETRFAANFNEQVRAAVWRERVNEFIEAREHYKPGSILYAALDAALGKLEEQANQEGWSDMKLLQEADRKVRAEVGLNLGSAPTKETPAPGRSEAKARTRAPVTLAEIPAADLPDTGEDRFAALDKLAETNSEAYERALARLTPEEQLAYANQ